MQRVRRRIIPSAVMTTPAQPAKAPLYQARRDERDDGAGPQSMPLWRRPKAMFEVMILRGCQVGSCSACLARSDNCSENPQPAGFGFRPVARGGLLPFAICFCSAALPPPPNPPKVEGGGGAWRGGGGGASSTHDAVESDGPTDPARRLGLRCPPHRGGGCSGMKGKTPTGSKPRHSADRFRSGRPAERFRQARGTNAITANHSAILHVSPGRVRRVGMIHALS